jgi:hypothetical protein
MCPGAGAASGRYGRPLRTLRCMQGMLSGGLLTAAFAAVAGFALIVLVRLFRISRPGGGKARAGG